FAKRDSRAPLDQDRRRIPAVSLLRIPVSESRWHVQFQSYVYARARAERERGECPGNGIVAGEPAARAAFGDFEGERYSADAVPPLRRDIRAGRLARVFAADVESRAALGFRIEHGRGARRGDEVRYQSAVAARGPGGRSDRRGDAAAARRISESDGRVELSRWSAGGDELPAVRAAAGRGVPPEQ